MRLSHSIGLILPFALEAMAQAYAPQRGDADSLPHTTLVTTVWSTAYTTIPCSDTSTWSGGESSSTWTGFVTTLSVTASLKPTGPQTLTVAGTVTESIAPTTSSIPLVSSTAPYPVASTATATSGGGGGSEGTSPGAAHTSAVEAVSSSVPATSAGGGASSAGWSSSSTTGYLTTTTLSSPSTATIYPSTTSSLSAPPLVTSAADAVTCPLSTLHSVLYLVVLALTIAWW